jgi:hypothetical protein
MTAASHHLRSRRLLFAALCGLLAACFAAATAHATTPPGAPPAPAKHPLPANVKKFSPPPASAINDLDEEKNEVGEASGDTYSSNYMLYRGGPVQTSPRLYVVFWGDWSWAGDPYDVDHRLLGFLKGVGGSTFNKVQTQYAQGCTRNTFSCPSTAVYIQNTANQFAGAFYDTTTPPTTPTHDQVAAEALKAARYFGNYSINAQYIVALPRGHGDDAFKAGKACAWHHWANASTTQTIQYTSLPYMPDAGNTCGNYSVNNSILDGVTIIESHEYAETETDPWVGAGDGYEGWDDINRNAGENGDKCSGAIANRNMTFSTGTFPVQAEWSNYTRYYSGFGCIFSI